MFEVLLAASHAMKSHRDCSIAHITVQVRVAYCWHGDGLALVGHLRLAGHCWSAMVELVEQGQFCEHMLAFCIPECIC